MQVADKDIFSPQQDRLAVKQVENVVALLVAEVGFLRDVACAK